MAVDSFKKRYLYKLTTNLINFFIAFLTVGIIPRALGVNTYGNYTFINNVFSQVLSFLEFRTSTCFFVKLSQNQNDKKILLFYLIYSLILLLCLTIVSTLIIAIHQIYQFIFGVNTIPHFLLFILFFYTFFNWLSETLSSALDSLGFTVYLEKVRILNKIFSALSILGLYHLKLLNLSTLITVQILLVIILIILLIFYLTRKKVYDTNLTRSDFSNYTKVFYKYSFPLFGYLVFQFTGNFFDRWYLQQEGGSFQQGIYSFSYSLMNFCYLFINAFQPLVTREFSITVGKNDKQTMSVLFQKFNSILFAVTGYLCAFIFVEAKEIIQFFGGDDYLVSTRVLQILMLYPLISTYSLLNGAILYSTEKTRLLFKLSFVLTPIGILFTFFLINQNFGLALGSFGLAIKNIVTDLISVIIILYINSKYLNFSFFKITSHFLYIIVFLLLAYFAHSMGAFLPINLFFNIFISGIIYTASIISILFFYPKILGIPNENVSIIKDKIYEYYYKWFPSSQTN